MKRTDRPTPALDGAVRAELDPVALARDLRDRVDGEVRFDAGTRGAYSTVPQARWNDKRERQYEHIKEGLEERGRSEDVAEEIAARTVNKARARSGEARTSSRVSTDDISSGRRGGIRSHRGPGGRTYKQLYAEARRKAVKGRSRMDKAELERAVGER